MSGSDPQYLHLAPGQALPALGKSPFLVVIVANEPVSGNWRAEVAAWLVDSGCLYAVAWGIDCERWHDAIDLAMVNACGFDLPDERLVMTTWHDDEPLPEAFWFAGHAAHHPTVTLEATVILHVATTARSELLNCYAESQRLHEQY